MQAIKKWARETLTFVALQRPDWDEWWEEFKRYNPVSAQITEEFWKKYRKKLDRLYRGQSFGGCSETHIKLYQNYYAKRVYQLREDSKHARLFRRRGFKKNKQLARSAEQVPQ